MTRRTAGCVVRALGDALIAALPRGRIGDGVRIAALGGPIEGEVVAAERGRVVIAPFASLRGVAVGDRVESAPEALACVLGFGALGRALDARGRALDGGAELRGNAAMVARLAPSPFERVAVTEPLWTRVAALDALLVIGRGARLGIFGTPGTGKSTLLEALAARVVADAVVVALIGERGREARAWLGRIDRRTTLFCATSDRSAAERLRAAALAMAHATILRERGLHVVMILDSLARFAAALREQRSASGEPLGRGGFPPSVWPELANYLERAGAGTSGSVSLFATVLTDGDDERDPLAVAARSLLDGHIVLSPAAARAGRFPAIDVVASVSRTMADVVDPAHRADADLAREAYALLDETRDLRNAGLADRDEPRLVRALSAEPALEALVRSREPVAPQRARAALRSVAATLAEAASGRGVE